MPSEKSVGNRKKKSAMLSTLTHTSIRKPAFYVCVRSLRVLLAVGPLDLAEAISATAAPPAPAPTRSLCSL